MNIFESNIWRNDFHAASGFLMETGHQLFSRNISLCVVPAPKKVVQQTPDKFLISPITGEKIPADKIQEHMRIGGST